MTDDKLSKSQMKRHAVQNVKAVDPDVAVKKMAQVEIMMKEMGVETGIGYLEIDGKPFTFYLGMRNVVDKLGHVSALEKIVSKEFLDTIQRRI